MHKVKRTMEDNSDVQAVHNGKLTDMRIEVVLSAIYEGKWSEPSLDTLYTELLQEFVSSDSPTLLVSAAGRVPHSANGLMFLSMFCLDYEVFHKDSHNWPGDFEYLPSATCCISIGYPNGEDRTAPTPGRNPSTAAIAALMQLCREVSEDRYNQSSLSIPLH
jgi:hypothetical protein